MTSGEPRDTSSSTNLSDDEKLAVYACDLIDGLDAHLGGWARKALDQRLPVDHGLDLHAAVEEPVAHTLAELRALLTTDIDEQRGSPLAVIRAVVPALNAVLADAGVAPLHRDEETVRLQPNDAYGIEPASFADLHPDLHLPGLSWGAAKAHVHLQRRSAEGLR